MPLKSEARRPKAERNPKAEGRPAGLASAKPPAQPGTPRRPGERLKTEGRIQGRAGANLTHRWRLLRTSAFGFRPSFGLRTSAFGFRAPRGFSLIELMVTMGLLSFII